MNDKNGNECCLPFLSLLPSFNIFMLTMLRNMALGNEHSINIDSMLVILNAVAMRNINIIWMESSIHPFSSSEKCIEHYVQSNVSFFFSFHSAGNLQVTATTSKNVLAIESNAMAPESVHTAQIDRIFSKPLNRAYYDFLFIAVSENVNSKTTFIHWQNRHQRPWGKNKKIYRYCSLHPRHYMFMFSAVIFSWSFFSFSSTSFLLCARARTQPIHYFDYEVV